MKFLSPSEIELWELARKTVVPETSGMNDREYMIAVLARHASESS